MHILPKPVRSTMCRCVGGEYRAALLEVVQQHCLAGGSTSMLSAQHTLLLHVHACVAQCCRHASSSFSSFTTLHVTCSPLPLTIPPSPSPSLLPSPYYPQPLPSPHHLTITSPPTTIPQHSHPLHHFILLPSHPIPSLHDRYAAPLP